MAIAKKITFLADGYNLETALQSISTSSVADEIDASVLAYDDKKWEQGFRAGSLSADGKFLYDSTLENQIHEVLTAAFGSGTPMVVTVSREEVVTGSLAIMMDGCVVKNDLAIPLGQLITVAANIRSNNGIKAGKWLERAQRDEGSYNGTSVDNSASTANGGLFHAHLVNTDATGVTVLLQHSTNNSAWVDLAEAVFGTRAGGSYTFAANPSDTDTIVFNGVTFTFVDTISDPTVEIEIQGTRVDTMTEAASVLNASTDPDVAKATYGATGAAILVTSKEPGTGGNAYTLDTPTAGNVTRSGATLTGGVDAEMHDAYSELIAPTTVRRYLRTVTTVYGGDTELVGAAFARR